MTSNQTTKTVIDLRLVAITPDRSHLVLEDSESTQYRVPVDARLAAALRSDLAGGAVARPGQVEITVESQLSPREIQTRIRAGHGVDEVARAAGISLDRVERYAGPVLAEREHVVEQAQLAPARRASAGSAPTLLELVGLRLAEQRVSLDSAEWDAWRGEDDLWTVQLGYLAGGRSRLATWSFDPRGRVLAPADEEACWLVDDSGAARVLDTPQTAVRRLAAVPLGEDVDGALTGLAAAAAGPAPERTSDEVYDREADETRQIVQSREAVGQSRPVASGRAGRHPAVPSWDDIMFGTRRRD